YKEALDKIADDFRKGYREGTLKKDWDKYIRDTDRSVSLRKQQEINAELKKYNPKLKIKEDGIMGRETQAAIVFLQLASITDTKVSHPKSKKEIALGDYFVSQIKERGIKDVSALNRPEWREWIEGLALMDYRSRQYKNLQREDPYFRQEAERTKVTEGIYVGGKLSNGKELNPAWYKWAEARQRAVEYESLRSLTNFDQKAKAAGGIDKEKYIAGKLTPGQMDWMEQNKAIYGNWEIQKTAIGLKQILNPDTKKPFYSGSIELGKVDRDELNAAIKIYNEKASKGGMAGGTDTGPGILTRTGHSASAGIDLAVAGVATPLDWINRKLGGSENYFGGYWLGRADYNLSPDKWQKSKVDQAIDKGIEVIDKVTGWLIITPISEGINQFTSSIGALWYGFSAAANYSVGFILGSDTIKQFGKEEYGNMIARSPHSFAKPFLQFIPDSTIAEVIKSVENVGAAKIDTHGLNDPSQWKNWEFVSLDGTRRAPISQTSFVGAAGLSIKTGNAELAKGNTASGYWNLFKGYLGKAEVTAIELGLLKRAGLPIGAGTVTTAALTNGIANQICYINTGNVLTPEQDTLMNLSFALPAAGAKLASKTA
ncbi:MAG: hypothetical protein WAX79_06695, partial [Candidatus Omnitrophota bacterium]